MNKAKKDTSFKMILTSDAIGIEEIAKAITEISEAFIKINNGPLTQRAIMILIKDRCPELTLGQIKSVLDTASTLKENFIKE